MAETVYLTSEIRKTLTEMPIGPKEKILFLLGERISHDTIFVTNRTTPFTDRFTSASLEKIPEWDRIINVVIMANMPFRAVGQNKFILFVSHSHPVQVGELVNRGYTAWSVGNVPQKYSQNRGSVISVPDKNNNPILFSLAMEDKSSGDDRAMEYTGHKADFANYHLFVRPAPHTANRRFMGNPGDIAIDCYKYDPEMILGKIRKIEISPHDLNEDDLLKPALLPGLLTEYDEKLKRMVLPYRRRKT